MTTARQTAYRQVKSVPAIEHEATINAFRADGQFEELRALVDRAHGGEIDLDTGGPTHSAGDVQGKLPSGWYAPLLPETPARRARPEVIAGLLGLAAGLVLLVPAALWWQYAPRSPTDLPTSLVQSEAPATRFDIAAVRPQPVARPVEGPTLTEVRDLMSVGEVIAARSLLATAVAARDPEALFLMAETYDPNMLAALGARGVGADTDRARGLYAAAQALGHEKARGRLQGLR